MVDVDLLIESDGLYMTTMPEGASFVWRLLSLKEYKAFNALRLSNVLTDMELHVRVFDRCYVGDPRVINGNLPAGIFLAIGELIMYLSGDCAGEEAEEINAARNAYAVASVQEVMKRIVLMAFPYKPEELDSWSRPRLTRTFVQAEALLQNKTGYEPLDTSKIMTPEQMAKQSNKPAVDMRRENMDLGEEFGDRTHALDRDPNENAQRARRQQKLKADQLRKLDASKRDEAKQKQKHRRR